MEDFCTVETIKYSKISEYSTVQMSWTVPQYRLERPWPAGKQSPHTQSMQSLKQNTWNTISQGSPPPPPPSPKPRSQHYWISVEWSRQRTEELSFEQTGELFLKTRRSEQNWLQWNKLSLCWNCMCMYIHVFHVTFLSHSEKYIETFTQYFITRFTASSPYHTPSL